jgi:hypothetical protein
MSETTIDEATRASFRRTNRALLIAGAIAVLVIGIVIAVVQMNSARADAERTDGYYCTLSGVSPMDRGPETGDLCADILSR